MAASLTSVVMQFLTPEVISQIASFLGLDRAVTQKAAAGTVPSLLAGLSELVETPTGSNQFSRLLSQQPTGSPLDLLREAGPKGLAETGTSMLAGLFGGRTMETMAQAIGKFAGVGDLGAKSLLGLLGPIVMGALGQHQRASGLDSNGLVSLLRSQKDQLVAAIPPGLADQLGAAGLIDRAEAGVRSGMATASSAASGAASAAAQRVSSTVSRPSAQWPYWLLALAVLGGLGWYAFQRPGEQKVAEAPAVTTTRPATGTVGMAPADLTVDGTNLANQINASVNTLKSALPSITDGPAAQAALPKINDAIAQLNDVSTKATKLSPEGRSALAKLILVVMPSINQMCDKVLEIPGAGPIAKPAIDDLRAKLDTLSKA
jgi:hypothetical protein